jgi:hypothetical protein
MAMATIPPLPTVPHTRPPTVPPPSIMRTTRARLAPRAPAPDRISAQALQKRLCRCVCSQMRLFADAFVRRCVWSAPGSEQQSGASGSRAGAAGAR